MSWTPDYSSYAKFCTRCGDNTETEWITLKPRTKYWISINKAESGIENYYTWSIKCINGRTKCVSGIYKKFSYCLNDARSLAIHTNLEIRSWKRTC